jgi:hypothetical protein
VKLMVTKVKMIYNLERSEYIILPTGYCSTIPLCICASFVTVQPFTRALLLRRG